MPAVSAEAAHVVPAMVRFRRWWLLPLLVWAGASWWLLQEHVSDIREQSIQVATEGARNMFRMVVLTRSWNASHAGIYVPVTPRTLPNPYLDSPRRDVTTTDGQALTLINPAYMTRLIGEMAQSDLGSVFRLTSLNPIRPQNAADPWERTALLAFERGVKEVVELTPAETGMLLRYMAPLMIEKPCLQCHAHQGYKLGDVRGGISVSQRYAPIEAASAGSIWQTQFNYGLLFVITAATGWMLLELLRRRWLELVGNTLDLEATRGELLQSEKMASLGRMVAGFAHEINTPVGVAVSAVSNTDEALNRIDALLLQEDVDEDSLRNELQGLRQGGALAMSNLRRAANLVKSFKRTSIDQTSDQVRTFEMRELIDDVLFALQSTLKKCPIEISVHCPSDLRLHGMPGLMQQLLTNLVMNAIQHAFAGGTRAGKIGIRVTRLAKDVHLEFSDDGDGMNAEQLSRIFEPFYTTRRSEGGSGLGLYICYNIVTSQLGGSIQCHSQPQAGCRFDIHFPAAIHTNTPEVS
ncbi:MAG: DUF3365 domain-containing protein [Burkholderiales bacterium]|nr:DUF3365 domain-containing protein [Burkholderiales bacterium]